MKTYQEHFDNSCALRDTYWKSVGAVEPDVIAHLINPAFMGGAAWPSLRQAFVTIHAPGATIIASDGLSDPFSDMDTNPSNAPYNGYGLEAYVHAEKLTPPFQLTWQFQLVYQAAQLMADNGNVVNLLNELTYLTTEFYNVDVPASFRNAEGRVGAIIGLTDDLIAPAMQLSIEPVKLVNIKLLTQSELQYVIQNGDEGRKRLAGLLIKQGNVTLSTLERPAVV